MPELEQEIDQINPRDFRTKETIAPETTDEGISGSEYEEQDRELESDFPDYVLYGIADHAGAETQLKSQESELFKQGREFYAKFGKRFQQQIIEVARLYTFGKKPEAEARVSELIKELEGTAGEHFGPKIQAWFDEYTKRHDEAEKTSDPDNKSRLKKLALEAVDFIPIVGSAKMIGEGVAGKTMSGNELTKGRRILHTVEGVVFLTLDLTGVGAIGSESLKATKLFTRSAAYMRKIGMAREVFQPVYQFGRFLIRHPEAGKVADKAVHGIIEARNMHKTDWFLETSKEAQGLFLQFLNQKEEKDQESSDLARAA